MGYISGEGRFEKSILCGGRGLWLLDWRRVMTIDSFVFRPVPVIICQLLVFVYLKE